MKTSYQRRLEEIEDLKKQLNSETRRRDKTREALLMEMTPAQRKKVILDEFFQLDNMPSDDYSFGGRTVPEFFSDEERRDIMETYRRGQ